MIKYLRHNGYTIYLDTPLGEGAFGKVYFCESDQSLDLYAAKIYHSMDQTVMAEMESLRKLSRKSEHVLGLQDFFKLEGKWVLVTEYCQKTLDRFVEDTGGRLSEGLAQKFFVQLLKGMKAINDEGIIHRDIKMENLLVKDGKLKVGDFGFAVEKQVTRSIIGTPVNMPPELLERLQTRESDMYYDRNIDVWSCGIVLYQMLFGRHPFEISMSGDFLNDLKALITAASQTDIRAQMEREPVKVSEDSKELLEKMFAVDKQKRYNFATIWNSKWVVAGLMKFGSFDENARLRTLFDSNMLSSSSINFKSEIRRHREASRPLVAAYFSLNEFMRSKSAELDFLKLISAKFEALIDQLEKQLQLRPKLAPLLQEDLRTVLLMRLLVHALLLTMYQYVVGLFDNRQMLAEKTGADIALLTHILDEMSIEGIDNFKNDLKLSFVTTKKYLVDRKALLLRSHPGLLDAETSRQLDCALEKGIYSEMALFESVVREFFSLAKKYLLASSMLEDEKFELELKWCFLLMHIYKNNNDKSSWESLLALVASFNDFDVNEYVRTKLGIERMYDGRVVEKKKRKKGLLLIALIIMAIAYLLFQEMN